MINKIYEKTKEEQFSSMNEFLKIFNITDDNENKIINGTPKKNFDLIIILRNLGLIDENPDLSEKINEFHEYLFKVGIDNGIALGKQLLINEIINDEIDFDEIMNIKPDELVNFNYTAGIIQGLMRE